MTVKSAKLKYRLCLKVDTSAMAVVRKLCRLRSLVSSMEECASDYLIERPKLHFCSTILRQRRVTFLKVTA